MTAFPHLLAPGRIGTMLLRNRLVMSPMETMYGAPDGLSSQRNRDYFAARARGGVGLIAVGATGIDHHHPETPGGLHLGPMTRWARIGRSSRRYTFTGRRFSRRSCMPDQTVSARRSTV